MLYLYSSILNKILQVYHFFLERVVIWLTLDDVIGSFLFAVAAEVQHFSVAVPLLSERAGCSDVRHQKLLVGGPPSTWVS